MIRKPAAIPGSVAVVAVAFLAVAHAGTPAIGLPESAALRPTSAATASSVAVPADEPGLPDRSYHLYVAAESDDTVSLVRFGPDGLQEVERIPVGRLPAEIEGPHGLNVTPDGKHWLLSLAHGQPIGSLHKFTTGENEWQGSADLGMFPATLVVSPATGLAYVVNFDLHGGLEPGTVSVVEVETMTEVARIGTGIMPHGSRLSADGTRQYHVAMMNDELVEVDAVGFRLSRVLPLSENAPSARMGDPSRGGASVGSGAVEEHWSPQLPPVVKPTWVSPPTPDGRVYVAGNGNDTIVEVDLDSWSITRTWSTSGGGSRSPESADGPYNLSVTPDGDLLVVTYKGGAAVGIWDVREGVELARIPTTRPVPHGVAISSDGRYAFVSVEGVGGDPGTVEAYDLESLARVASLDVGPQAGGIAFWKIGP